MAVKDHKIFLVGCGSIGKRHAECLHDIGIDEFVFFDPEQDRAVELAQISLWGRTGNRCRLCLYFVTNTAARGAGRQSDRLWKTRFYGKATVRFP